MMTHYFSVKNFAEFQHYKDRSPPWIKLYNNTLDDYDFCKLPDASKSHLIAIWLLASRTNNRIPCDSEWIKSKINATTKVDLDLLVKHGFIVLEQGCSIPLADCNQSAIPEKRREEKRREEKRRGEKRREVLSPSGDVQDAFDLWNITASKFSLPKAQSINLKRKNAMGKRLEEVGGLDGWKFAMSMIENSSFLQGKNDTGWTSTIDFMLQPSSLAKVMEGNYTDKKLNGKDNSVTASTARVKEYFANGGN